VTTPSITLRGFSKAYSALTATDCPFAANDDTKTLWCNQAKTMTGYFSTKIWISSTSFTNFKYFWIGSSYTVINSTNEGGTDNKGITATSLADPGKTISAVWISQTNKSA
jgi:hypothetical protein